MRRLGRATSAALAALSLAACSDVVLLPGDGGVDLPLVLTCPEGVDPSVDPESAFELAAGEEHVDYICPRNDLDYYEIEVPAGKLLHLELRHMAAVTNLRLGYLVATVDYYDPDVAAGAPECGDGMANCQACGGAHCRPGDGCADDGSCRQLTVVAKSPASQANQIDALHCLPADRTTFLVMVRSEGNAEYDNKNPYRISYGTVDDPDGANEPDDDQDAARSASPGGNTGHISCTGDRDFFKVDVDADQLLRVELTTDETTTVEMKYTVYFETEGTLVEIGSAAVENGSLQPALLTAVYPLAGLDGQAVGGSYYIVVEDAGGDDSDITPGRGYTLLATAFDEPDENDRGTRNDHPTRPTDLLAGGTSYAGSDTGDLIKTGFIASAADVDWYRIRNGSGDAPSVIEVELTTASNTIDPAVELVYVDSESGCTRELECQPDASGVGYNCPVPGHTCVAVADRHICTVDRDGCCAVHAPATACSDAFSCAASSYSCVAKGQAYCNECVDQPSAGCAIQRACAGAVVCINGSCGVKQFARHTLDGAPLLTAQPLRHPGHWYLRVSDFASDEYDTDNSYTLRVRVLPEPDANEPNNNYFPRLITFPDKPPVPDSYEFSGQQVAAFFRAGRSLASTTSDPFVQPPTPPDTEGPWSDWLEGFISYEHDEDWFTFKNPCGGDRHCLLTAEFRRQAPPGSQCKGARADGSGLELLYLLEKGAFQDGAFPESIVDQSGFFPADGGDCTIFVRPNDIAKVFDENGYWYVNVSDYRHNGWDWSCRYFIRFKIRAYLDHDTCPPGCVTHPQSKICEPPPEDES